MIGGFVGVALQGAVYEVLIAGNRIVSSSYGGVDIEDPLPGARDVVVVNNTLGDNDTAPRIYDDKAKGQEALKCKNMRFQNNLVLSPREDGDLFFLDHPRGGPLAHPAPGDLAALLKSPGWHISHNWREVDAQKAEGRFGRAWIPRRPGDSLQAEIEVLSREPGDQNFVRPPKGSPLAKGGVGDKTLPAYVGAVPPEGVAPWDWEVTWKSLVR